MNLMQRIFSKGNRTNRNIASKFAAEFRNDFRKIYYGVHGCPVTEDEMVNKISSGYCVNMVLDMVEKLTLAKIDFQIYKSGKLSHWFISVIDDNLEYFFDSYHLEGEIDPTEVADSEDFSPVTVNELLMDDNLSAKWRRWKEDKRSGRGVYITETKLISRVIKAGSYDAALIPTEMDLKTLKYIAIGRKKCILNKEPFDIKILLP